MRATLLIARSALIGLVIAGSLVACGSPTAGGPDGASRAPTATDPADPGESIDVGEPTGGTTPGNEPGGVDAGPGQEDVTAVATILVPPNATESMRTTADGTWFAMYESTDSVDSLKGYYADAFRRAGLEVFSTTEASGGISWALATDASGSFGGAVSIFPSGNGSNNAVQVTIGRAN